MKVFKKDSVVKPNVKRMTVNGKMKVIKYELIIADTIYLEKDEKHKVYNFYFPSDAPNNIYHVGVSMPIKVLEAYDHARFEMNIQKNVDKVVGQGAVINSVLPDMEDIKIGD